jgi:hypothetical protein
MRSYEAIANTKIYKSVLLKNGIEEKRDYNYIIYDI